MDIVAQFLSMLTLVFAIASIIAGAFTAYFGSGKSRAVGAILIIIGLIVFGVFLYGAGLIGSVSAGSILNFKGTIIQGIVAIVGALVGAVIALGIFLLAIMKA
ncbi:MAG TPA: hypothetical protein ENI36_00860 [Thermoplasmatales archaeon]|nr:hypothetical protein [Thermoplasmatales archaeon]